jgi:UDP-N-acetylmuramate--alanine ligase
MSNNLKHYHFIGVGGIGMGALACLVLAKGGKVSGSDLKDNAMTRRLQEYGAKIVIGHQAENIKGADCVIFSSAVSRSNPELQAAFAQGIPILRRAELLAELMEQHIRITIAGAHGKTTTTSMIGSLLHKADLHPTVAVGGIRNAECSNADLGSGKYFVAEADESDGSFLCYSPHYSVITNIDYEHIDYYLTWDNILMAYRKFILRTQPEGVVIACGDDARLRALVSETGCKAVLYGFGEQNDALARNIQKGSGKDYFSSFECWVRGKNWGRILLAVPGEHNVLNALACACLGLELGIKFSVIQKSLLSFQGVNRRFQRIGQANGITVFDDYGHHPTEIRATLRAAQDIKPQRLITIFQPHRYTRTKYLMDDFVKSLPLSDVLIVTDIYAASEQPIEGVSSQILFERIQQTGYRDVIYLGRESIVQHLLEIAKPGDWILTLGAGDVYQIGEQFLQAVQNKELSAKAGTSKE